MTSIFLLSALSSTFLNPRGNPNLIAAVQKIADQIKRRVMNRGKSYSDIAVVTTLSFIKPALMRENASREDRREDTSARQRMRI